MRMTSVNKLEQLALAGSEWKGWYDTARESLTRWCWDNDVDLLHFIAVLALTSPQMQVWRNVKVTKQYMKAVERYGSEVNTHRHVPGLLGSTHRRALEVYEETGRINGPKTRAFADALLGNGDAIVLDTHMATALGVSQADFRRRWVKGQPWTLRTKAEMRVRKVAKRLQWTPAEVQASIWTAVYKSKHTEAHLATNGRIEDYL